MAPADAAQKKRNRLPFKPPRQQSSATTAGASKATKPKPKATSRKSTSSTTAAALSVGRRTSTGTGTNKRKAQSLVESEDEEEEEEEEEEGSSEDGSGSASSNADISQSQEPDYILAEIITNDKARDIESGEPAIPPKLLTKLLHHHFQNPKTKIAKDANEVVAKYIDIFVREALARAAYERTEGRRDTGDGRPSVMDGFLEVEDLEKLAPQMILDF